MAGKEEGDRNLQRVEHFESALEVGGRFLREADIEIHTGS
jgi:hypothetical protein